jgi:hypothetical protein
MQLNSLPELPENIELEIRKSLMQFSTIIRSKLQSNEFSSMHGRLSEAFRDCLLNIKPKFTLKDETDIRTIDLSDDEPEPGTSPPKRRRAGDMLPPSNKRVNTGAVTTPTGFRSIKTEENGSPGPTNRSMISRAGSAGGHMAKTQDPFAKYARLGAGFRTIRQISEEIKAQTKGGMPDHVTSEVYNNLCRLATQPWSKPMETFILVSMNLLRQIINSALDQAFGCFKERLIFKDCQLYMQEFLEERRVETLTFLTKLYKTETHQLFTLNKDAFDQYKEAELRLLTRYRHHVRWHSFAGEDRDFMTWESMTHEQRVTEEKRAIQELAKMGPDKFSKELEVAAYVRGYYWLSALRFADTVSMSIASGMFPEVTDSIDFYLDKRLGLVGATSRDIYVRLMEEDEQTAMRRERLKGEVAKFERAMESIYELERQTGAGEYTVGSQDDMFDDGEDPDMEDDEVMEL